MKQCFSVCFFSIFLSLTLCVGTYAMAYEIPNIAAAGSRSQIVTFDTIAAREAKLAEREAVMAIRENELAVREAELAKREATMAEREAALAIRDTRFDGNLPSKTASEKSENVTNKPPVKTSVSLGTVRYLWGGSCSSGSCASGTCGW